MAQSSMSPEEAARCTGDHVATVPARFMMAGDTYKHGASLGFDGIDFYFAGRGGVLGDTSGQVVASAFVYFNHQLVVEAWERGLKVMSPGQSALEWAGVAHAWAEEHFPAGIDYGRLAELLGKVVAAADLAGAPLFAGWRLLPEPGADRPEALAMHRLNSLRELRGGLHAAAVLASGLSPVEAVSVRTPFMAKIFGLAEPLPDPEPLRAQWEKAEEATNRMVGRCLAVLAGPELDELVELVNALPAS